MPYKSISCFGKQYYKGPKSDHFDGKHFFNPWNPYQPSAFKVLYWKLTSKQKKWPHNQQKELVDIPPERVFESDLRVSFVGHSTVLLQTEGLNILTDPIWSERASPFQNYGPKRYTLSGIPFEKLPSIDVILISHNHYDHLDIKTLKKLCKNHAPLIITPLGNDIIIKAEIPEARIKTLDWHNSFEFDSKLTVHLSPSQHWSSRSFFDKNKALWGAFILATPSGNTYFCGDSGYGDGHIFKSALKQFGKFRFAMIPIGAFEPRWFMKYAHMNPEEAVLAYHDLGNPYSIAIHYETFRLADEGFEDPKILFGEACKKYHVPAEKFRTLRIGESWMVPKEF